MKKRLIYLVVIFCSCMNIPNASGNEISGHLSLEGRIFFEKPRLEEQEFSNFSLALRPEYYHEFSDSLRFTFIPFFREDSADSERTHFDIREMNLQYLSKNWYLNLGIGTVFWGVTEFMHLVNIINQTDLIEHIEGEEKLGQPMLQFNIQTDWGSLDSFILPYFRERTFPGRNGRLRSDLPVDTDNAEYESSQKDQHVDYAIRYSHNIRDCDFGLYYFEGTSREPALIPEFNSMGIPTKLTPFYPQIQEAGMDIQLTSGQWLFKCEALYRDGQENRSLQKEAYTAVTAGFEYTLVRFFETPMDFGLICEYVFDERGDDATNDYEDDIILGLRLAVNDTATSELLLGFISDMDSTTRIFKLQASTRIGRSCKANIEGWLFKNPSEDDLMYSFRDENHIIFELAYYF